MKDEMPLRGLKELEKSPYDGPVLDGSNNLGVFFAKQRAEMQVLLKNMRSYPQNVQVLGRLVLATSLVEGAAYALAQSRPGHESTQLFLIASNLETQIGCVSDLRQA